MDYKPGNPRAETTVFQRGPNREPYTKLPRILAPLSQEKKYVETFVNALEGDLAKLGFSGWESLSILGKHTARCSSS